MEASSFISNLCSRTIPPSRVPTDKSQAWKSTPLTKALQQSVGLGQICPSDRFQSQNGLLSLGPLHPPATFGDAPKVSRSSRANSFPVGKNQIAGVVFAFRASLSVCLSVCLSVLPRCHLCLSFCPLRSRFLLRGRRSRHRGQSQQQQQQQLAVSRKLVWVPLFCSQRGLFRSS